MGPSPSLHPPFSFSEEDVFGEDILQLCGADTIDEIIDELGCYGTELPPQAPGVVVDHPATPRILDGLRTPGMSATALNSIADVQTVIERVVSYTHDSTGSCPPQLAPHPGYDGPLYIVEMTNNVMVVLHGWRAQVEHSFRCVMAQRLVDLHIPNGRMRKKTNLNALWQTALPVLQSLITDKGIDTWIQFARKATLRMDTHGEELRNMVRSYDRPRFVGADGCVGGSANVQDEDNTVDTFDIGTFFADDPEDDEGPTVFAYPSLPCDDMHAMDAMDPMDPMDPMDAMDAMGRGMDVAVGKSVDNRVDNSVGSSIGNSIGSSIGNSIGNSMGGAIRHDIGGENITPSSSPETVPVSRPPSASPNHFRAFDFSELECDFRPFDFSELTLG